ncbi:hypothetical protein PF011_g17277 [Phytophthora fragariae]|uniref:Glutathione S-transferase n=1 Tax=Phytophthora fragariae TaxID=53985 RepID=A0A6A3JH87_9STRA|nr:hypothetical protein PF011_g17277 [Phytophthora fragariae]
MSAFPALKLSYFGFAGRAEAARLAFYVGGVPFEDKRLSHEQFADIKPSLPLGQVPALEVDGEVMTQTYAILRYAGRLGGLYPVSSPFAALKVDEVLHALCEMGEQMIPSFQEQDADKKKAMRVELATSLAILRFAGSITGLYPTTDPLAAFRVDEIFVLIDEMFNSPAWRETVTERDHDKLLKMREGLAKGIIPKTLDFLEKRVAAFKGQYATGKALTVADLAIYAVVLLLKAGRPGIPITIADPYENLQRVFGQVKAHPKVVEWNSAHA